MRALALLLLFVLTAPAAPVPFPRPASPPPSIVGTWWYPRWDDCLWEVSILADGAVSPCEITWTAERSRLRRQR